MTFRSTPWLRCAVACSALAVAGSALLAASAVAQQSPRPPATPLVTHNPYFSIWSDADTLNDSETVHWTGHANPLTSLLRIDGKVYRVMGRGPGQPLQQTARQVTALHTIYRFTGAGVAVTLTFFTPAFTDDLDVMSRPVTYLTWTVASTDGASHKVEAVLDASADLATSYPGQPVTTSRARTAQTDVVSVGSRDQQVLNRSGDDLRIDWGYFRIAVPHDEAATLATGDRLLRSFTNGELPQEDDLSVPTGANHHSDHIAAALDLGSVGQAPVSRHVLLTYTEDYSFQLFHQNLRPYWQRNGMTVGTMLDHAATEYSSLEQKAAAFETSFQQTMTAAGGEQYAWLCTLSYRQAIAAHTLVAGADGEPLTFEKENFSNGDTATVDVIYPGAPIWLLFNPKLLHAEVLPVLRYASMTDRWHFPFAPHDLGQFPLANGQEYGGGEKTEEDQMPVEETGNLLILVDALARAEKDTTLAAQFWPRLSQWAEYLRTHGLDPENQLTTDDFAGHVAHNSNLSIKAAEGVAAYAHLAKLLHHEDEANRYNAEAHRMATEWLKLAREGDHYKLAFNSPGTWSQKYNLVWDKLLHYDLFPASVARDELAFYKTKINRYGLPLDSRRDYTKLDWEIWTGTLADDDATFQAIMSPIYTWLNEGPTRVPLTDWYDTKTGKQEGFQARSVVGGVFIKALRTKMEH
ncbi:glutaminase family protein [Terriglobus aquaticus]|uniref:Glutaminase domain-containing protein n=1 Tax=Terriglobus aquaticus TaxID=940139 RepID=A0ABW9KLA7_9BACT|nr:glutaminase family protein [Terriglobus aquaticus]